jgi:hypothetical protein
MAPAASAPGVAQAARDFAYADKLGVALAAILAEGGLCERHLESLD